MQSSSHSIMHGADFGGDKANANSLLVSINLLEQLEQDNGRLHKIVAQLLLKNQKLRWQLSGEHSLQILLAPTTESEREA